MSQATQVIVALAGPLGEPIMNEALSAAGSAIVPGMIVEELADGTVQENTQDGDTGFAQQLVAMPNIAQAGTIDAVYDEGANVQYGAPHGGQELYLAVAAGAAAITRGDRLTTDTDGTVKVGGPTSFPMGFALESVDNSGGADIVWIRTRMI